MWKVLFSHTQSIIWAYLSTYFSYKAGSEFIEKPPATFSSWELVNSLLCNAWSQAHALASAVGIAALAITANWRFSFVSRAASSASIRSLSITPAATWATRIVQRILLSISKPSKTSEPSNRAEERAANSGSVPLLRYAVTSWNCSSEPAAASPAKRKNSNPICCLISSRRAAGT